MAKITGGDKMRAALQAIAKKVSQKNSLRVGFLENARYPDGTSVPMVAAIQEFGAPRARIPPRPFFRPMVAAKKAEWGPAIAGLLPENDYDVEKVLNIAGAAITGQLQQSISDVYAPKLSPVTLMLRKMKSQDQNLVVTGKTVGEAARRVRAGESVAGIPTKPLIDFPGGGHMRKSASWEVS